MPYPLELQRGSNPSRHVKAAVETGSAKFSATTNFLFSLSSLYKRTTSRKTHVESTRTMTRERGSCAESKNCEILLLPTAGRRFDTKVKCRTGRASFWVKFPTVRARGLPGGRWADLELTGTLYRQNYLAADHRRDFRAFFCTERITSPLIIGEILVLELTGIDWYIKRARKTRQRSAAR